MKLFRLLIIVAPLALALLVAETTPAAPTQQAVFTGPSGAALGSSVAISGDTAVIGADATVYSGGNNGPGAAYVYVRNGVTWTQQAVLTASNPTNTASFGHAVAIEGNTIVIGAPGEKSNAIYTNGNQANTSLSSAGAAYVFTRSGTTWTQKAYLKASNTQSGACFGTAVAISGTTVAVGAGSPKSELGYEYLGNNFGEQSNATGVDGNMSDQSAPGAGAVYLFEYGGSNWRFDAYVKASNTGAQDGFGSALALSHDTLVVGALGEDSGASGVNGNQADNSVTNAGAAYVFTRVNNRWSQQAYLKADVPRPQHGFGASVAISDDTVAVGSFDYTTPTAVPGVHLFTRNAAGTWTQQAALSPINPGTEFGFSVALWRDTLIVGEVSGGASATGAVHLYRRSATGAWTRESAFSATNLGSFGGFGFCVAIDGDAVAVGSGSEDNNTSGQNTAWIYGGAGSPNIAVEQPAGVLIAGGGTRQIATVPGTPADMIFTMRNTGAQSLHLTGTPNRVAMSGSSDFTITAQPAATVNSGDSTTCTVHFAPTTTGVKTATLTIPSDDADQPSYVINLTGRGLSNTDDTDGDGMSDAAEYYLASLGFDWQVSQPAQVSTYFANANNAGLFNQTQYNNNRTAGQTDVTSNPNAFSLYSPSQYNANRTAGQNDVISNPNPFGLYDLGQVQSLNVGVPLLQKNPTTGNFTLTIGVKQSSNPATSSFTDFPMTGAGISTTINSAGKLEFEFPASGRAAFYRVQSQ